MNFGFFVDQDQTRYCCLRLRRLKQALADDKIVAALADELEISRGADRKKTMAAIERRIDELRAAKASLWYGVPAAEVAAAAVFSARARTAGEVEKLFCQVARVQDMAAPLGSWLTLAGLPPHVGPRDNLGAMSLAGYRAGGTLAKARLVGIEAANAVEEVDGALDRLKALEGRAHALYLACTPALGAAYLTAHASAAVAPRWDAGALLQKLRASGFGLLLVEGDAVAQALLPKESRPSAARLAALVAEIGA